jgi:uncharacterized protein YceK
MMRMVGGFMSGCGGIMEVRNPKSEIRSPKEVRNPKAEKGWERVY